MSTKGNIKNILIPSHYAQSINNTNRFPKFYKLIRTERLGEDICRLLQFRNIQQLDGFVFNQLTNVMTMSFNMLGSFMEDWILGKFEDSLIITKQRSHTCLR